MRSVRDTLSDNDPSCRHVINCGKFKTAHLLQPLLTTTAAITFSITQAFTASLPGLMHHVSWPHLIDRWVFLFFIYFFHLIPNWCSMVLCLDKTSAWLRQKDTPNITCTNDFSLLQAKAGLQAIKLGNTQAQEMRMNDDEQGELCLL